MPRTMIHARNLARFLVAATICRAAAMGAAFAAGHRVGAGASAWLEISIMAILLAAGAFFALAAIGAAWKHK